MLRLVPLDAREKIDDLRNKRGQYSHGLCSGAKKLILFTMQLNMCHPPIKALSVAPQPLPSVGNQMAPQPTGAAPGAGNPHAPWTTAAALLASELQHTLNDVSSGLANSLARLGFNMPRPAGSGSGTGAVPDPTLNGYAADVPMNPPDAHVPGDYPHPLHGGSDSESTDEFGLLPVTDEQRAEFYKKAAEGADFEGSETVAQAMAKFGLQHKDQALEGMKTPLYPYQYIGVSIHALVLCAALNDRIF